MLPCAALMLVAGGCSTAPPVEPVVRTEFIKPALPISAVAPCNAPTRGPDRDLSAKEVASLWGRDRASLRACEAKRKAAVEALS